MQEPDKSLKLQLEQQKLFPHSSAPWQQTILSNYLSRYWKTRSGLALDAASGVGNNLETLLAHVSKVKALDASQEALDFSKPRHSGQPVAYQVADIHQIPYPKDHFDVAVCTEALEHCQAPAVVVKELYRVVKPGGLVVLSAQNHCNLTAPMKFVAENVLGQKNWDAWGTHDHEEGYENYLSALQLKGMAKQAGFTILEDQGADYLNAWFSWLPFVYRNYALLDSHPMLGVGKVPGLKYLGMDYFIALSKKPPHDFPPAAATTAGPLD